MLNIWYLTSQCSSGTLVAIIKNRTAEKLEPKLNKGGFRK
jgi:hypothetical protein